MQHALGVVIGFGRQESDGEFAAMDRIPACEWIPGDDVAFGCGREKHLRVKAKLIFDSPLNAPAQRGQVMMTRSKNDVAALSEANRLVKLLSSS